MENKRKQDTVIVVKSKERGARTKVTTCCYSTSGSQIVGGLHRPPRFRVFLIQICYPVCYDGAMHLWSCSSNFVRPNATCESAHAKGTETGSVQFDFSGNYIATRGGDGTVKSAFTPLLSPPSMWRLILSFLNPSLGCSTIEEEPVHSIQPPRPLSQHERYLES